MTTHNDIMNLNDTPSSPQPKPSIFFSLVVIEAAMHFSVGILVFIAHVISGSSSPESASVPENIQLLIPIFSLLAFTEAMLSLFFPLIKKPPQKPKSATEVLAASVEVKPFLHRIILNIIDNPQYFQTMTIIRMAMAESIVVFGLVLALLTHQSFIIYPFAAAGLIIQIIVGPVFAKMVRG